jgi:hypothetical protein
MLPEAREMVETKKVIFRLEIKELDSKCAYVHQQDVICTKYVPIDKASAKKISAAPLPLKVEVTSCAWLDRTNPLGWFFIWHLKNKFLKMQELLSNKQSYQHPKLV